MTPLRRAGYQPARVYPVHVDDHDWRHVAVPGGTLRYRRCANCGLWPAEWSGDPCPNLPRSRREPVGAETSKTSNTEQETLAP